MNDIVKWAEKMRRIGNYKKATSQHRYRKVSLRQRIALTEELLTLPDNYTPPLSEEPSSFLSLSKALEQKYARKK